MFLRYSIPSSEGSGRYYIKFLGLSIDYNLVSIFISSDSNFWNWESDDWKKENIDWMLEYLLYYGNADVIY